jgi:uncharacterized repeat protein (TIGR03803 family)
MRHVADIRAWVTNRLFGAVAGLIAAVLMGLAPHAASAQKLTVLHSFDETNAFDNGFEPLGAVVFDPKTGTLFATASLGGGADYCSGGDGGCGVAFKLAPDVGKVPEDFRRLYIFGTANGDGQGPSGLVADGKGNLYGVTALGGLTQFCEGGGCGVVYELEAPATGGGTWSEHILYAFPGGSNDGVWPEATPIRDAKSGMLYGTTCHGQGNINNNTGEVFSLTPPAKDQTKWGFAVLHQFNGADGGGCPTTPLTIDKVGNLYGTTSVGGDKTCNCGVVFELSHTAKGWTPTVLHRFVGGSNDGETPSTGLIFDSHGNLIGATSGGGPHAGGTVFEIPSKSGGYGPEKPIYIFQEFDPAGGGPMGDRLAIDAAGNLYGTARGGGTQRGGTVFKLTLAAGKWAGKALHNFCSKSNCADGEQPHGGVIRDDGSGDLYGTTFAGGKYGYGTVFKLTP